jgi:DNA-binding response OmpR family regulator
MGEPTQHQPLQPAAARRTAVRSTPSSQDTARSTQSILVVDDDEDIRTVVSHNLEGDGFRVVCAAGGDEAIEKVMSDQPDLVILDIMMPVRDGYDVLAEIRRRPETADLPVVLLTAKRSETDIWEGWSSGADYYMTKPFEVGELLRFVHYVFGD